MGVGGSGMSASSDLDLAVQGGKAYTQRLEELAAATEKYQKAVEALTHGQNAKEAHEKAARMLEQAKEERAGILAGANQEAEVARSRMNDWVEATKLRTMAAFDEAQTALVDARSKQEAAASAEALAKATSTKAKAEAASLIEEANIKAGDIVDAAHKQADKITAQIKAVEAAAQKVLSEAQAMKDKLHKAVETIRTVVV